MNLQEHKVEPQRFWEAGRLYDGYDRMDIAAHFGWHSVSSWGRDGWDLGEWPLVVFYFRTRATGSCLLDPNIVTHYELATNVEGDTDVWDYPTVELRSAAVDNMALFYWRSRFEWAKAAKTADDLAPMYRGPFSWARLDREKEATTQ